MADDVSTPLPTETVPVPVPAPVETPPVTAPIAPPVDTSGVSDPIRARFSTLANQRRAAEERAARLENIVTQQSEQLREALEAIGKFASVNSPAPPAVAPVSFDEPRPARESYPDPESYDAALVSWAGQKAAIEASSVMQKRQEELDRERNERAERERGEAEALTARKQQEETDAKIRSVWNERRSKAAEKYEDYIDVAEDRDLPVSVAMAHTLMHAEDGAEILYYLGKHREEAARIAGMIVPGQVFPAGMGTLSGSPIPDGPAQAYELGRIAAKLGLEIAPVTPAPASPSVNALASPQAATPITVLPPPPQPIAGNSAPAINRDINSMTMEEYAAHRLPQIRAQRSPGRSQLQ